MGSSRTRYLMFFQYFGTKFSGVVRTPPEQVMLGVQNHLERAAEKLQLPVPAKFVVSSRTDSGVHAFCNAAHVDIEREDDKSPLSGEVLAEALNYHLGGEPISVLSAHRVPETFHARFSAQWRTYVYRIATGCTRLSELPVFERNLCWATYQGHLNVSAMREAAELLTGTHDFSTFRSATCELPVRSPIRTLACLDIRPASSFLSQHWENSDLKFWELEFVGRSFLYKQVRRMTGILVAVGQNRLQPHHVRELLEARDLMAYPTNTIAPAHGLFLKRVEYYRSDLEPRSTETEPQPS